MIIFNTFEMQPDEQTKELFVMGMVEKEQLKDQQPLCLTTANSGTTLVFTTVYFSQPRGN